MAAKPVPIQVVRGGFGKLPTQPEFIRVNAGGREVLALDQWVQEGLYRIRTDFAQNWTGFYDHRLFHRFIFRADNCGQTVVGVIRGAMDIHERRFPFIAFCLIPTQYIDNRPTLIPTLNDQLFRDLETTIEEVAVTDALPAIKNRLMVPETTSLEVPPAVEARYQTFLDEVEIGELGFFGRMGILHMLNDLIATLAGSHVHPRRFSHWVELPLEQAPYARGLEIRFWLELCMILLQWYPPTFSLFWSTGTPPPRRCTLTLAFRQMPGLLMRTLLQEGDISRGVWRPGQQQLFPGGGSRSHMPLPVREDHTLRHLLQVLCPGYPGVCRWNRPVE